ncbi:MAG: tetratricopeptide repeat protein [Phycisphaeraceae bacterium]|nr:tetratricopeptide repeat protein [Phycisphaeraceae bacterium]
MRTGLHALAALSLFAAILTAYGPGLSGPFFLDDLLIERQAVPPLRGDVVWRTLSQRRGLTNLTFTANLWVHGRSPFGFRLINVLLHAIAAIALMECTRISLLLRRPKVPSRQTALALAWLVAMLWALHPMQVSVAGYVIQRYEGLMGLCFITTLLGVALAARPGRGSPAMGGIIALSAMAIGLGTKETILVAPLVALLYDRIMIAGDWAAFLRRRGWIHAGLWLLALSQAGVIVHMVQPGESAATPSPWTASIQRAAGFGIEDLPWNVYLFSQPPALMHYLRGIVWPVGLMIDYGLKPQSVHRLWRGLPMEAAYSVSLVLVCILIAIGLVSLWRRRPAGFLIASALLVLAPTSSVIPILDPVFDHRMYLPLAFAAAGATWVACSMLEKWPRTKPGAMIVAIVVLSALAGVTLWRNVEHRSARAMWERAVAQDAHQARGWNHLARAQLAAGDPKAASIAAKRATTEDPLMVDAYVNRGQINLELGQWEAARQTLSLAIRLRPADWRAHQALALAWEGLGQLDQARQAAETAVQWGPDQAMPRINLGRIYLECRQIPQAEDAAKAAIQRDPSSAPAWNLFGLTQQQRGQWDQAVAAHTRALACDSNDVESLLHRGACYRSTGQWEQAYDDYVQVTRQRPEDARGWLNLGAMLLLANKPNDAIPMFDRTLRLQPELLPAYLNRAAALVQVGLLHEAEQDLLRYQQRGGKPDPKLVEGIKQAKRHPPTSPFIQGEK